MGVERFMGPISSSLKQEADGNWVRFTDYAALQAKVEQVERERLEWQGKEIAALDGRKAAEAKVERLEAALRELQNGPDTLTQNGLRIVNAALLTQEASHD